MVASTIERLGLRNYQVHTQIEIDAPASRVWETLTDFANHNWSSSFKGLDGPIEEGAS